jgi:Na+/melibiose symporter-like transporter
VLQSSVWGWVAPHNPPTVGGHEIAPLGFSVVPFLILIGFGLLVGFSDWEQHLERTGRDTLLDRSLLKIGTLRAGLSTLAVQQLVLMGTFFVLPVYLQVVLGLDAFETGKRLFPMSIAMLAAALCGPRLAARFAPKRVAQLGLVAIAVAAVLLVDTIDVELTGWDFAVALVIFGIGAGLLVSQLGNVIMSSVDQSKSNEAGGLQGTAQNLGASLGTALIGAVLLTALTAGFVSRISNDEALPAQARQQIEATASASGLEVVPVDDVQQAAVDAGLSQADAERVATSYGDSLLDALKRSLGAVAFLAFLGLALTRGLPGRAAREAVAETALPPPAAASAEPS